MNPNGDGMRIQEEDAGLLARIVEEDEDAFSRLYDRYAGLLYGLACRMLGSSAEAEDAVQEAFLEAWERADEFDAARGPVRAWLALLARSRCLDRLRRIGTRRRYESAAANGVKTAEDGAQSRLERSELGRAAVSALGALPLEQRKVLEAAFFEGLSQREIASKMGEPLGTVKTRMRSGARKLAEGLKGWVES